MSTLPVGPGLPGLSYRFFLGESDIPAMARVMNACREADRLPRSFSGEEIALDVASLAHSDPYQDFLFAEVDGTVVGFGRGDWRQETAGNWVFSHTGWVVPSWRRNGIGREILRWQEGRVREIASGIEDPSPRFLQGWAWEDQAGKKTLLVQEGYTAVSYVASMVRPDLEGIARTPLPEGIEVRPVLPEHYRAVFQAENEAFRDHPGHSEYTEEDFESFTKWPTFDPTLWRVAWAGDEIVGMVRSFIRENENEDFHRRRGYSENISVRRPWRQRGVARALLGLSLQALRERGMEEAALEVHLANPNQALHLYESAGFRETQRLAVYRKFLEGAHTL